MGTVPRHLRVTLPADAKPQHCAGLYDLVAGQLPNGKNLWKHRSNNRWMHFGTDGWYIDDDFNCDRGYIASEGEDSKLPHKIAGWIWYDYEKEEWISTDLLTVRAVA